MERFIDDKTCRANSEKVQKSRKGDMRRYKLHISNLDQANLQSYKKAEYERVKRYYEKGDKIAAQVAQKHPSQKKGILLFKEIAHSWLKQAYEVYIIQKPRK